MSSKLRELLATMRFFATKSKIFGPSKKYNAVNSESDDDEGQSKLLSCPHCENTTRVTRTRSGQQLSLTYSGWVFSAIVMGLLIWLVWLGDVNLKQKCFRATSSYSPLISQVPNDLIETTRNGSIRWPSVYRGPPSPNVDKAWDRISMFRPLNIQLTEEEYLKIGGKSPATAARNAPEHGGGIFLQPEFSHQLHCVNLLRKASHFKYSYYRKHDPDFRDKDEVVKVHLDHCVEMLRQFVMCHADVGLVTAHWLERRDRPWPDFNTKQTCRNFDAIWQWTIDHQLPEGTPIMPLKPAGAKGLASPP